MYNEEKKTGHKIVTRTIRLYKRPVVQRRGSEFLEKAALWMMLGAIACALWMICIAATEVYKKFGA